MPYPLNRPAYRRHNLIERVFCCLKNWRRIVTRYDRLARNYLVCLALIAVATEWCKSILYLAINYIEGAFPQVPTHNRVNRSLSFPNTRHLDVRRQALRAIRVPPTFASLSKERNYAIPVGQV